MPIFFTQTQGHVWMKKNPCSRNHSYFYKSYDVMMDLMGFLHIFQAENSFSSFFAIYYAPIINKVSSARDSSVLISDHTIW